MNSTSTRPTWTCLIGLTLIAGLSRVSFARPLDKQLSSHCVALLLGGLHTPPASREDALAALGEYLDGEVEPAAGHDDVRMLELNGWNDPDVIDRSRRRLARLALDLKNHRDVSSVAFLTRERAESRTFLERLELDARKLDDEAQIDHGSARSFMTPIDLLAAGALVWKGFRMAHEAGPSWTSAWLASIGVVATLKHWLELAAPRRALDVRRVQVDADLRVVDDHPLERAHLGLSILLSADLLEFLQFSNSRGALDLRRLAQLLAESTRDESNAVAKLLVDHLTFTNANGRFVRLSAGRLVKIASVTGKSSRAPLSTPPAWAFAR